MNKVEIYVGELDYGNIFPLAFQSNYLPRKGNYFMFCEDQAEIITREFIEDLPNTNEDVLYSILRENVMLVKSVCFFSNGDALIQLEISGDGVRLLKRLFLKD